MHITCFLIGKVVFVQLPFSVELFRWHQVAGWLERSFDLGGFDQSLSNS